jgi:DNA-binding response OmpR family regulator
MKILLLEDDYLYSDSIKDFLSDIGYEIEEFEDGKEALDAIFANSYDLLLLDIRVPSIDGFDILKEIRDSGINTPVIFLTSLVDIDDLSRGYELGCSDYIRKPFELKELKYRIEQSLKANLYHSSRDKVELKGGFSFDIIKQVLYKDGKEISLSAIEKKLVATLVQERGYYLSLDSLWQLVWEGKEVSYADIRMTVARVRQKCGSNFIKTKKMVGYRVD